MEGGRVLWFLVTLPFIFLSIYWSSRAAALDLAVIQKQTLLEITSASNFIIETALGTRFGERCNVSLSSYKGYIYSHNAMILYSRLTEITRAAMAQNGMSSDNYYNPGVYCHVIVGRPKGKTGQYMVSFIEDVELAYSDPSSAEKSSATDYSGCKDFVFIGTSSSRLDLLGVNILKLFCDVTAPKVYLNDIVVTGDNFAVLFNSAPASLGAFGFAFKYSLVTTVKPDDPSTNPTSEECYLLCDYSNGSQSAKCIFKADVCDGFLDCRDGSDENTTFFVNNCSLSRRLYSYLSGFSLSELILYFCVLGLIFLLCLWPCFGFLWAVGACGCKCCGCIGNCVTCCWCCGLFAHKKKK